MSQTEEQWQAANYQWYKACKAEDRRRFVPEEIPQNYDSSTTFYTKYTKPNWLECGYRRDWDYELSYANNFPEEKADCTIA